VGDGSELCIKFAAALLAQGLRTAVVSPGEPLSLPGAVSLGYTESPDKESFLASLAEAGRALAAINLVVLFQPGSDRKLMDDLAVRSGLENAFLTARFVQPFLNLTSPETRAAFVAVSRMDGRLGLGSANQAGPASAGLAGMVRSLSQEWPEVFCREIDFDPGIPLEDVLTKLSAEIEDADTSIVEVGWTMAGRSTPVIVPVSKDGQDA